MSDPAAPGLLLMIAAIATFMGTTAHALPSAVFFPALQLFATSAIKFLRSNTRAIADAEKRVANRLNPNIRENRHAQAHAEMLAAKRGQPLNSFSGDDEDPEAEARRASGVMASAIEFDAGNPTSS